MRIQRLLLICALSLLATTAQARQPVFVSLYGGGTTFDAGYEFAQPIDLNLEDDGDVIGIGVGYEVTDRWIMKLDYTYSDADEVTVDQLFLSLNYKFPLFINRMHGVVGGVIGEGKLDWEDKPDFANSVFDDLDADQSIWGVQVGLEYDLNESWSTSLMYQYFDMEFKTHLDTTDFGRASFFHEEFQYVLFGVSYHF